MEAWSDEQIYSHLREPKLNPLLTVEGDSSGPEAPEYGVVVANLALLGLENFTDTIKIIDYGESFFIDSPPQHPGTKLVYAPPETILENRVSPSSDIWSLACALFHVRLGGLRVEPLFEPLSAHRMIFLWSL